MRPSFVRMIRPCESLSSRPTGKMITGACNLAFLFLVISGFYLWFRVGDAWDFTERLVRESGALLSPGDFYGAAGSEHVRVAVVQPDDRIDLVARRLGIAI